jgi:hypothetical protein
MKKCSEKYFNLGKTIWSMEKNLPLSGTVSVARYEEVTAHAGHI